MSPSRWFVCTVVTAMALMGAGSAMAAVLYSQLDSPYSVATVSQGLITLAERDAVVSAAGQSSCGK
jgi:hypothetical protein